MAHIGYDGFLLEFSTTRIFDLQPDVFKQVLAEIHIWHYPLLRRICQQFQIVSDSIVKEKLQSELKELAKDVAQADAYCRMKILKYTAEVYMCAGYEEPFYGCLLALMDQRHSESFCLELADVGSLVQTFFKSINAIMKPEHALLLHSITLLRLLKKFPKFRLLSHAYDVFEIEIKGSYLGVLWPWKADIILEQHETFHGILIMLASLLIAAKTRTNMKKVVKYKDATYVLGNDTKQRPRQPKMLFIIKVDASTEVHELLRMCLIDDATTKFTCPNILPVSKLRITLDIICNEAIKAGGIELKNIECNADEQKPDLTSEMEIRKFDLK